MGCCVSSVCRRLKEGFFAEAVAEGGRQSAAEWSGAAERVRCFGSGEGRVARRVCLTGAGEVVVPNGRESIVENVMIAIHCSATGSGRRYMTLLRC